ncbi:MAG: YfeK family protein [Sulfuricaulis sp.]
MGSVLIMGLLLAPAARAEPPTNVKIEVNFLLGYVEGSGCNFYRNGTWHDSKAAQAHLRMKYNYLALRNMINTTEEFILRAATKSSLSGKPYKVKCHGGAIVTSNQWLSDELARFRKY